MLHRLCLAVGLAVVATHAAASPELTIVANPGRFASIDSAASAEARVDWWDGDLTDDDACTESFAATELRHYLAACLRIPDSSIALASPDAAPRTGTLVVIGSRRSNPRIAERSSAAPLPAEGFRLSRTESDGRVVYAIEGGSRAGTLYGAYAFLERAGMRFFGLGETGTVYPAAPATLPDTLDREESPGFTTRGFWAWEPRGNRDFFLWMARNRMNLWTAAEPDVAFLRKLAIQLVSGGHMIQKVCLDPEVYFAAHPDWYALIGGRRRGEITEDNGANFCTSNRVATATLAHNLLHEVTAGRWRHADALAFWMLDVGKWCECANCKAQGSETDRLFDVLRVVSDTIETAHRDGRLARPLRVTTLAFLETMKPPKRPVPADLFGGRFAVTYFPIDRCYSHAIADPACKEVNVAFAREYGAWAIAKARAWQGAMEVGEYYNIGELKSLPPGLARTMAADIPWYWAHGARHFHTMHALTADWGTWTLAHVLLARLLWNPGIDPQAVLGDFFPRYYPTSHERARRFHAHLEAAMANAKLLKQRVRVGDLVFDLRIQMRNGGPPYALDHFQDPAQGPGVAADIGTMNAEAKRARAELEGALAACRDSVERRRLEDDRRRFAYGEATLDFYQRLLRVYTRTLTGDAAGARAEWPRLERVASRLRAMKRVVQVSASHANAANGLEATRMLEFYDAFRKHYGATR